MSFLCPNCGSKDFLSKHSIGKTYKEGPYINVKYEIQCSECFMDIPSNLCENVKNESISDIKKLWFDKYKPEHFKHAAKCSKCNRYYWEIEKSLYENNITSKDIFYQNYSPHKGGGSLVCKICDPDAFK